MKINVSMLLLMAAIGSIGMRHASAAPYCPGKSTCGQDTCNTNDAGDGNGDCYWEVQENWNNTVRDTRCVDCDGVAEDGDAHSHGFCVSRYVNFDTYYYYKQRWCKDPRPTVPPAWVPTGYPVTCYNIIPDPNYGIECSRVPAL